MNDRRPPVAGALWRAPAPNHVHKPEKLWGAPAIANVLGVSETTVAKWALDPEVPIYKPKGFFARRSELEKWLRTKPKAEKTT